jgi:hypothetical protein
VLVVTAVDLWTAPVGQFLLLAALVCAVNRSLLGTVLARTASMPAGEGRWWSSAQR